MWRPGIFKGPPSMAEQGLNCAGEPETLERHARDSIKENQILVWIYNFSNEAAQVDFEFFLKDGGILCSLMNRIKPGIIPEEKITFDQPRSKQQNIQLFLDAAKAYGVPGTHLFFPEDLLQLRHIPRVTRCIYKIGKLVEEDPAHKHASKLGDEPNFVDANKKKELVPGHRDIKDVTSSLVDKKDDKKITKQHSLLR